MVGDDRALELVDRRVERPQLRKQNPQRRLDHRRKVGAAIRSAGWRRASPASARSPLRRFWPARQIRTPSNPAAISQPGLARRPSLDVADPFGGDDTELREMTAQGVHAHRALLDQQFAVLCAISVACWSSLLMATKRMFGRDIASQIAAASAVSFLPRLT